MIDLMKMTGKRFTVSLLAVLAVMAFSARCEAGTEKITEDAKAAIEKARDVVNDVVAETTNGARVGARKVNEVSTNVAAQVKVTVRKATEVTTNVFVRTKESVTNTTRKVNQAVKDAAH